MAINLFGSKWIPWNLSFRHIHWTGQFTPKMKANAIPRLFSSLVWISLYNECNRMTSFIEFMSYLGGHPCSSAGLRQNGLLSRAAGFKVGLCPKILDTLFIFWQDCSIPKDVPEHCSAFLNGSGYKGLNGHLIILPDGERLGATQWRCELTPYSRRAHLNCGLFQDIEGYDHLGNLSLPLPC